MQTHDRNEPTTYARHAGRVLQRAREQGRTIVSNIPGAQGIPVDYAPRNRSDSLPWVLERPGRAPLRLNGRQCRVEARTLEYDLRRDNTDYTVTLFADGRPVGHLTWKADGPRVGEIRYVWILPTHRRRGLATALFYYATQHGPVPPVHSADLSRDGRAWVRSLEV